MIFFFLKKYITYIITTQKMTFKALQMYFWFSCINVEFLVCCQFNYFV